MRLMKTLVPVAALMVVGIAHAQDMQTFNPSVGANGVFVSPGARTTPAHHLVSRLTVGASKEPLVLRGTGTQKNQSIIDRQLGFDLGIVWGSMEDLEVGINVPFGHNSGLLMPQFADEGLALGDIRFSTKLRLHGAEALDDHGVAIDFTMSAPTGNEKRLYGSQGFTFQPRLLIDGYLDEAQLYLALGFLFRPETDRIATFDLSHDFIYSAGFKVSLDWTGAAVIGEVFGSVPLNEVSGQENVNPLEGLLGLNFVTESGVSLTVGTGFGLIADRGVPSRRLLFSIGYETDLRNTTPPTSRPGAGEISKALPKRQDLSPIPSRPAPSKIEESDVKSQETASTPKVEKDEGIRHSAPSASGQSTSLTPAVNPSSVRPKNPTSTPSVRQESNGQGELNKETTTDVDRQKAGTTSTDQVVADTAQQDSDRATEGVNTQKAAAVTTPNAGKETSDEDSHSAAHAESLKKNDSGPQDEKPDIPSRVQEPSDSSAEDTGEANSAVGAGDTAPSTDTGEKRTDVEPESGVQSEQPSIDHLKPNDDKTDMAPADGKKVVPLADHSVTQQGQTQPKSPSTVSADGQVKDDSSPVGTDKKPETADDSSLTATTAKDETSATPEPESTLPSDDENKPEPGGTKTGPLTQGTDSASDAIPLLKPIVFASGKSEVTGDSEATLRHLAQYIKDNPERGIVSIEGHSSHSGSAKTNIYITSRRAQEIRNRLIEYGVDKSRLVYAGYGWTRPLVPADAPGAHLKNRRIEVRWVRPGDATFRIKDIQLVKTKGALIFRFKTSRPIQREHIEINLDGPNVLMVRLLGAQVYRRWLELNDPWIKKSLLHPSTEVPPAGILRVRLTKAFADSALQTISGSVDGEYVEVRIPRQ